MQRYHVYSPVTGTIFYTVISATMADLAANAMPNHVVPAPEGTSDATHRVDIATRLLVAR